MSPDDVIRRQDILPVEDEIVDSIKTNLTGRNEDLVAFLDSLNRTEGPYVYLIDAQWGEGKTFFVKSLEYLINALNPNIPGVESERSRIENILPGLKGKDIELLPFYFNALEYDFANDPLCALFAVMAAKFDKKGLLRNRDLLMLATSVIDAGLSLSGVQSCFSSAVKRCRGKNLVEAVEARSIVLDRIQSLAASASQDYRSKLVLFIDELDRCRPDFAVRLLEQINNLFNTKEIIVVLSTNSAQLTKAISGVHGAGFDSERYFARFFDRRWPLASFDSFCHVNASGEPRDSSRFDCVMSELADKYSFSFRDNYRCKELISKARDYHVRCCSLAGKYPQVYVASWTILPAIIALHYADKEAFDLVVSGKDPDALFGHLKSCHSFLEEVSLFFLERMSDDESWNGDSFASDLDVIKAFIGDLCISIYGDSRPYHFQYVPKVGDFSEYDRSVYKRLLFEGDRPEQPILQPGWRISDWFSEHLVLSSGVQQQAIDNSN